MRTILEETIGNLILSLERDSESKEITLCVRDMEVPQKYLRAEINSEEIRRVSRCLETINSTDPPESVPGKGNKTFLLDVKKDYFKPRIPIIVKIRLQENQFTGGSYIFTHLDPIKKIPTIVKTQYAEVAICFNSIEEAIKYISSFPSYQIKELNIINDEY